MGRIGPTSFRRKSREEMLAITSYDGSGSALTTTSDRRSPKIGFTVSDLPNPIGRTHAATLVSPLRRFNPKFRTVQQSIRSRKVRSWLLEMIIEEAAGVFADDVDIDDGEEQNAEPERPRKKNSAKERSSAKANKRKKK